MQFLLGIVLAASESAELRSIVAEHLSLLSARLAETFGRDAADPSVVAFVDQLRGLGFRLLLEPEAAAPKSSDIAPLAAKLGLISK